MAPLSLFTSALALLAAGAAAAPAIDSSSRADRVLGVPIVNPNVRNPIANSYIVVYNSTANASAIDAHQAHVMGVMAKRNLERRSVDSSISVDGASGGRASLPVSTLVRTFRVKGFRAMSLRDTDDRTMVDIFSAPEVAYIEQDAMVHTQALATEGDAPSGLARLSHADIPDADAGYVYDTSSGDGITAFVVDTGIQTAHAEFQGRAEFGANFVNTVNTDENGHGTHVSGTIGGRTYGVAKNVRLVAVKVLDASGSGANSNVIAGLNWVATNVTASGLAGKSVLNMSLGGSRSQAINDAMAAILAAGVVPCVAAGNDNADASRSSPASAAAAIAIGAIDQTTDARASFSNYGAKVALFAPGVQVLSAWIDRAAGTPGSNGTNLETNTLSGTSMATPHVAGLAAYLMALENITDPSAVLSRMQALAAATGAQVQKNMFNTTGLIANNGNQ